MCGIYGILFLRNKNIKSVIAKTILRKLMVESQRRGTDATGLSFSRKSQIVVYKHNLPAKELLKLEDTRRAIDIGLADSTEDDTIYSVIGHARQETQGRNENMTNNHPIMCGSIIGVHNGMIFNDTTVFYELQRLSKKIKRIGEVDSEAIFSGINFYGGRNKETPLTVSHAPITKAIEDMCEKLHGSMACAMQDADNPKIVWLFRRSNPLVVQHFRREGMIIFASEKQFITNSVETLPLEKPEEIVVPANNGVCFNLNTNTFNNFGPLSSGSVYT